MAEKRTALENDSLLLEVEQTGAQLARIYDKEKGRELLWEGRKEIWGRHSPILFPFVGRSFEDSYIWNGSVYPMGQHGFARDMDFSLVSADPLEAEYLLEDTEETRKKYPFSFKLYSGFRLEGRKIHVIWKVENKGESEMYFMIGAHPALRVPEGKTIYDFSFDFHKSGSLHYQSPDPDGYEEEARSGYLDIKDGTVPLTKGFFKDVLTYIFDKGQVDRLSLLADGEPYVTVECSGFPYTALWTVEETHPFVCIEPWFGRCAQKGFSGELNDREGIVCLEKNGVFQTEYVIEIH